MISRIDPNTGAAFWTVAFTPASSSNCVSKYREIGGENIHATIVGDESTTKTIAVFLIDLSFRNVISSIG